jgi:aryl-alcohol dehydrogenase-like predicted oxidoreductase
MGADGGDSVSESARMRAAFGFGVSGPLATGLVSARQTSALIAQAIDGGVIHFDTAPFYGEGEAERRLGDALSENCAARAIVSTKTGTKRRGRKIMKDFSAEAIRRDVEGSLRRLRRERLDMLFLHGPHAKDVVALQPLMEALRAEGKIGLWGVCGWRKELSAGVEAGAGALMGSYNIVERRQSAVFAEARENDLVVCAVTPLAQALFLRGVGPVRNGADLWRIARARLLRSNERRAAAAARSALETVADLTPVEAALLFVLEDPLISVAFTTTANPAHLAQSLAAREKIIARADLDRLRALTPADAAPS